MRTNSWKVYLLLFTWLFWRVWNFQDYYEFIACLFFCFYGRKNGVLNIFIYEFKAITKSDGLGQTARKSVFFKSCNTFFIDFNFHSKLFIFWRDFGKINICPNLSLLNYYINQLVKKSLRQTFIQKYFNLHFSPSMLSLK